MAAQLGRFMLPPPEGGVIRPDLDRPETAAPGATLREVGRTLLRRRRLIVVMLLTLSAVAVVALKSVTPSYTAEASVLIGPRQARVLDLQSVMASLSGDSEVVESEVQLLRSRGIARRVAEKLRLLENPEFNTALRQPGLLSAAWDFLREKGRLINERLPFPRPATPPEVAAASAERARDTTARVVDEFLRRLWVAPRGRSRVVQVTFDSADPALAAAAVNGVVEAYIEDQLRTKIRATEQAHGWLADRVAELRGQVIAADEAVEARRRALGITQGVSATVLNEQISAASDQTSRARLARAEAEARLRAAERAAAAPALLDALPEVRESMVVRDLRQQEAALRERLAGALYRTGEQNPAVLAARAELREVQARLRAEVERTVRGLQARLDVARTQEATLAASLDGLQQQAARSSEGMVELRALQHEADAIRALYERLLARSKETQVESGLQQPDAQVISQAEVPGTPSFPKPAVMLPIFFVASCVMTALLVLAVEGLDRGYATPEQVERELGVAALGLVPTVNRRSEGAPEEHILERPNSAFGEALRSFYTSLTLSDAGRPQRVVLLASALPGEGKTTIALSLARLMASSGKRVVLVDCNLRSPTLHDALGVPQSPGITDWLSGQADAFGALRRDTASSAWVLPAGSALHASPDLFASGRMRLFVEALAKQVDLVILDSSALLAVSDARNLCRIADKTVLVVRWMDTRRYAVLPALRQIFEAGGDVAGVLLSRVDMPRYARYAAGGLDHRRIAAAYAKA